MSSCNTNLLKILMICALIILNWMLMFEGKISYFQIYIVLHTLIILSSLQQVCMYLLQRDDTAKVSWIINFNVISYKYDSLNYIIVKKAKKKKSLNLILGKNEWNFRNEHMNICCSFNYKVVLSPFVFNGGWINNGLKKISSRFQKKVDIKLSQRRMIFAKKNVIVMKTQQSGPWIPLLVI